MENGRNQMASKKPHRSLTFQGLAIAALPLMAQLFQGRVSPDVVDSAQTIVGEISAGNTGGAIVSAFGLAIGAYGRWRANTVISGR
jgi:hypothetical protein